MPAVPSTSPATDNPTSSSFIHTLDCNFVDNAGRTLLLRGVNLSGSSKAPVDQPSYILENFWEDAQNGGKSFVGRPLNLDDGSADVHLARLSGWGFNMLRFPVTWEALEHEGPGIYDYEFMDYTVRVLRKCKEYEFKVYMDPHQDIWSRFSGGSGAPFWTLEACGINYRNLNATQAAIIHSEYPAGSDPDPASLPAMIWSTNYGRLFSQTLFTLFFAGRDFAPKCIIDGKNIQDYLQEHYIEAMGQMADRIRDAGDLLEECVIGWDSMNEPFEGLCGRDDLNVNPTKQGSTLKKGSYPTPAQSLRLGMGTAQTVENWTFGAFGPSRSGSVTIDPRGKKVWVEEGIEDADGVHPKWGWRRDKSWKLGTCIWAQHGVWDVETGYILRPDYFRYLPEGREPIDGSAVSEEEKNSPTASVVEFVADYWRPHWVVFTRRIRASHPEAIMFIQPPVFAPPPPIDEEMLKGRCAFSGHYYDGLTLITRHWSWFNADALGLLRGKYSSMLQAVRIGESAIRKSFQDQLGMLKDDTRTLGPYPTIIGEIGTPFDMDDKRSYGWTDGGKYQGDYSRQERALDASLNGADGGNAINYTIWTYCPDSCHDWGDGWNMEDLSLWSEDDVGGRMISRNFNLQRQDGDDGSVSMYTIGADDSQAVLLRKKISTEGMRRAGSAATSSLSLATLTGGPGGIAGGDLLIRWRENPYDFLTDGARAVRAFSRPYPIKVVGRSKDIHFDIGKAYFKLVVNVRAEDRPRSGGVVEQDAEEGQELATEIYVPVVHYAHQRLLRLENDSGMAKDYAQTVDSTSSDGGPSKMSEPMESREAFTINVDLPPSISGTSTRSSPTATVPSPNWHGLLSDRDLVDVEVQVSGGHWAVQGQVLKWWYEVPGAGEDDREYTIEIKRNGGVITTKDVESCCGSWVEQLCPPDASCRIM